MLLKELQKMGIKELKQKGIEESEVKARLLLQHELKVTREYLIINNNEQIEKKIEKKYIEDIQKIIQGVPLQHITQKQEFMGNTFFVNENVLIPRPDTEVLVEEVINILRKEKSTKILDICTGSGAIAISIAKNIENVKIYATDISKNAIEVAKKNAKINKVEEKIEFIESNLFKNISENDFNIIVSNPPYIESEVIKTLDIEVQKEPIIALDGGIDGLDFYREIIEKANKYLSKNGYLCLEIGYHQKEEVTKIIEKYKYKDTYSKKDLGNNDRIIITKVGE